MYQKDLQMCGYLYKVLFLLCVNMIHKQNLCKDLSKYLTTKSFLHPPLWANVMRKMVIHDTNESKEFVVTVFLHAREFCLCFQDSDPWILIFGWYLFSDATHLRFSWFLYVERDITFSVLYPVFLYREF